MPNTHKAIRAWLAGVCRKNTHASVCEHTRNPTRIGVAGGGATQDTN